MTSYDDLVPDAPPEAMLSRSSSYCGPRVKQTAFAPTVAVLSGVPIPFSSLGAVVPCLVPFSTGPSRDQQLLDVLEANARQLNTYLGAYYAPAAPFADAYRAALAHDDDVIVRIGRLVAFLEAVGEGARENWAQFGDVSMGVGIALAALSIPVALMTSSLSSSASASSSSSSFSLLPHSAEGAAGAAAIGLLAISFGSNSYVVHEDATVAFLLATLLALRARTAYHARDHRTAWAAVVGVCLVRLSAELTVCREEQEGCIVRVHI